MLVHSTKAALSLWLNSASNESWVLWTIDLAKAENNPHCSWINKTHPSSSPPELKLHIHLASYIPPATRAAIGSSSPRSPFAQMTLQSDTLQPAYSLLNFSRLLETWHSSNQHSIGSDPLASAKDHALWPSAPYFIALTVHSLPAATTTPPSIAQPSCAFPAPSSSTALSAFLPD